MIASSAAAVARGIPSTSTTPPTTDRPSSGKAGQSARIAPGYLPAHVASAPRSCPATEPRIVESTLMNSRSHPRATSLPPRTRAGGGLVVRPGPDAGDHGEQAGSPFDLRPRGEAAQHVRGPSLHRELHSRVGGAGQIVGHQAHQSWSHVDLPRQARSTGGTACTRYYVHLPRPPALSTGDPGARRAVPRAGAVQERP